MQCNRIKIDFKQSKNVDDYLVLRNKASRVVTLDTSGIPFTFVTANATTIINSVLFDSNYVGAVTDGQCDGGTTQTVDTNWNMFSRQLLNGVTGISVSNGDSLSVEWTITISSD